MESQWDKFHLKDDFSECAPIFCNSLKKMENRVTGHFAQKTFRTSLLAQVLDCLHNS